MSSAVDLEAAGLLEGLAGSAREQRRELLGELLAEGVELEELRSAVAEGRVALLSVERSLVGQERYSPREVAELAGVDQAILDRQWGALGMVVGDHEERTLSREDLEAAHRVRGFLDAGLDPEGLLEVARVMAMAMSQVAAANRQMVTDLFAQNGGARSERSELETAHWFRGMTETLVPMVGPALEHVYKLQLREQIRHAAVDEALGDTGEGDGGELMAIGFADLVGFTKLGERLPPEEFGRISARFGELASQVAHGPVRLVKLIGDAVMLASADPAELVEATLELLDLVEEEGEDFPGVRAGVGLGRVIPRGGDFYGRTVNLASRLTGVARPGSLLVGPGVQDRLADRYRFSFAGSKRLKGIDGAVEIWRCRDLEEADEADGGEPTRSRGRRRRRRS